MSFLFSLPRLFPLQQFYLLNVHYNKLKDHLNYLHRRFLIYFIFLFIIWLKNVLSCNIPSIQKSIHTFCKTLFIISAQLKFDVLCRKTSWKAVLFNALPTKNHNLTYLSQNSNQLCCKRII